MKEVTYKDWQKNPIPRMMWCWDEYEIKAVKRMVLYLFPEDKFNYNVIALDSPDSNTCNTYRHCTEIEEPKPKTRRMTNKEFTLWLLEGIRDGKLRQWRRINSDTIESVPCGYTSEYEDLFVENKLIRENGGEWREPLVGVEE